MDDSLWDSDPAFAQESEWSKITSDFTNAGYREGITNGKESALQAGFDIGYAQVGVPLGREIGLLRGTASALFAILFSTAVVENKGSMLSEVRDIQSKLSDVRFSDIVPRDLEAEQHAREHLATGAGEEDIVEDEQLIEKRGMEQLENMMTALSADGACLQPRRLGLDDVRSLKDRLFVLGQRLGITLSHWLDFVVQLQLQRTNRRAS